MSKRDEMAEKWAAPMWGITLEQGDIRVAFKAAWDAAFLHDERVLALKNYVLNQMCLCQPVNRICDRCKVLKEFGVTNE